MGLRDWWADYREATPGMAPALRIGLVAVVIIVAGILLARLMF